MAKDATKSPKPSNGHLTNGKTGNGSLPNGKQTNGKITNDIKSKDSSSKLNGSSNKWKPKNGTLSSGNSKNFDSNALPPQKSIVIAYILWLFGGIFGLHHIYLHRDRHAFIWWCTLGGYFGIGWISEIFLIPGYVRDANEDPQFIKKFVGTLHLNPHKPPNSSTRVLGEIMIGYLFGQLCSMAIPQTIFGEIDWTFLHWLIPVFVALGVWTVGNIGRERGVLWQCLIGAFASYPCRYFIYDETYTILLCAIVSTLVFDQFSKRWLRSPPKRRGTKERIAKFTGGLLIYFSLWGCFLYFNGTISDEEGNEIPIHDAIKNFLATAWWKDLKQALKDTYNYAQHHGFYETWKEIFESLDVDGERNAYKVLGVTATASQAEITSAYRRLSKEFHPDKVKDEALKAAANQRFIEIQQAYNVLSKIKSSRRRKNKQYSEDEPIVV